MQPLHAGVFGLGWGDEGKGKVVDLLCPAYDVVVRVNGGANAGHTVWVGKDRFAFHLLPTGIIHPHITAVIGPGVVVEPTTLWSEIEGLNRGGMDVSGRLKVSDRAHLVLTYHKIEDLLSERAAGGQDRLGTTAQGIGPCYADKMKRHSAVRCADLLDDPELESRVVRIAESRRAMFKALYGDDGGLDTDSVVQEVRVARQRLAPFITDTASYLQKAVDSDKALLIEGANGLLLDVDHGTYPFVTSSSTGPFVTGAGAGIPLGHLRRIIGVTKAYATRVGAGPFVSELRNEIGERIREQGREYGTTTGRPRRCGWFDAVACRYSAELCAPTDLALLHLDTLTGIDPVGICTAYRCDGHTLTRPPADWRRLERSEPIIEYLQGWRDNPRTARRFEDLPGAAREFVARIETLIGVPATILGVGPDRSETLVRGPLVHLVSRSRRAADPIPVSA